MTDRAATPVYAVDVSVWHHCDAECSPDRGYYHPSRHSAGQPIVTGWVHQFIARLNFVREGWTVPMDVERVRSDQEANAIAVEQIERLLGNSPRRDSVPLFVRCRLRSHEAAADTGVDSCQILVRLRAGRRFYGDPNPSAPRAYVGRPRRQPR